MEGSSSHLQSPAFPTNSPLGGWGSTSSRDHELKYNTGNGPLPIVTPVPIKQEVERDSEDLEDEDEELQDSIIKPQKVQNILSTSEDEEEGQGTDDEDSEESVSGFEEEGEDGENRQNLNASGNSSSSSSNFPLSASIFPQGFPYGPKTATSKGKKVKKLLGKRTKREAFTLQQKLEVLKFLGTHSVNATSRIFKVDPKSIRLWRSQKEKIEQTVQEELIALQQEGGGTEAVTVRKRISGAGRKKKDKVIVEILENPNKRHRRTIKLSDKVEIIRLIENGQTQSDVARSLGISQSTVQTIWSNKGDILERNLTPKKKRKNLHWKKYSIIDSALFNWLSQARAETGLQVDNKMLVDKAVEYAEYYKKPEFKAQAQRWIDLFKRKHSLSDIDRQEREQQQLRMMEPLPNPLTQLLLPHQQGHGGQGPSSSQGPQGHGQDAIPDFDLSSFPGLISGLYTHQQQQHDLAFGGQGQTPQVSQPPTPHHPNFNPHLPAVPVSGGPVTTCDAMKYVEFVRTWISGTFGEREETLNNHLNAVENAILKRRMSELLSPK